MRGRNFVHRRQIVLHFTVQCGGVRQKGIIIHKQIGHRRQIVLYFTIQCGGVRQKGIVIYRQTGHRRQIVLYFAIDCARPLGRHILEGVRVYINKNQR